MRRIAPLLVAAVVTASPATVAACSVCFVGGEESRVAYKLTALLLTLTPLLLVGGMVLWLRGKARRLEQEAGAEGRVPPPTAPRRRARLADLWALGKPRVTAMNVLMALGGLALADGGEPRQVALLAFGTWLVVSSANTLNMVLERDSDKLMARTANRPLPAGRMSVSEATTVGLVQGLAGGAALVAVNPITAALGLGALVAYVLVYTPLKPRTPLALLVGAIPGAAPPLMGWTAATGRIDLPGLALFAILVAWQVPHFLGIALYRDADYRRAGLKTVATVRGERVAKAQAVAWCTALVPLSLSLSWLGLTSAWYGAAALALSLWFLGVSLVGLRPQAGIPWARRFFRASLVYLPVLVLLLAFDVALR